MAVGGAGSIKAEVKLGRAMLIFEGMSLCKETTANRRFIKALQSVLTAAKRGGGHPAQIAAGRRLIKRLNLEAKLSQAVRPAPPRMRRLLVRRAPGGWWSRW